MLHIESDKFGINAGMKSLQIRYLCVVEVGAFPESKPQKTR
jgi:hypothetical protein